MVEKENSETKKAAEKMENTPNLANAESIDQTLAEQIAADEHHMYLRSQQHLHEIEDEVRNTQPLISEKREMSFLVASYDPEQSPAYFEKALFLSEKYSHFRQVRGDGNCFYRAVLMAVLEAIYGDTGINKNEVNRLLDLVGAWRQKLFAFGFPELTTGDFCDAMETLLNSIKNDEKTMDMLFDDLKNENMANYYVAFLRLICSGFLRENEANYKDFIEGGRSLDQYCKDEVEPMWKECDHLCIIALINALKVPLRIEYMDLSEAPSGRWFHDFIVPGLDPAPKIFFLYRPGHYDILYIKKQ